MSLRSKLKGARATVAHRENALARQLAMYLRMAARLDTTLKAVHKVVKARAPVESLRPFLDEHVRVVRVKGIPKEVWKQAADIFRTNWS
jgi:hypothetical protein